MEGFDEFFSITLQFLLVKAGKVINTIFFSTRIKKVGDSFTFSFFFVLWRLRGGEGENEELTWRGPKF